jgi:hypothetical protein
VAVECPHTVDNRRECRCRREFPVLHGSVGRVLFYGPAVTVPCVSHSFKRTKQLSATVPSRSYP